MKHSYENIEFRDDVTAWGRSLAEVSPIEAVAMNKWEELLMEHPDLRDETFPIEKHQMNDLIEEFYTCAKTTQMYTPGMDEERASQIAKEAVNPWMTMSATGTISNIQMATFNYAFEQQLLECNNHEMAFKQSTRQSKRQKVKEAAEDILTFIQELKI